MKISRRKKLNLLSFVRVSWNLCDTRYLEYNHEHLHDFVDADKITLLLYLKSLPDRTQLILGY